MKFRRLQEHFQPEVARLVRRLPPNNTNPESIHNTPLYLPSSLDPSTLSKCSERLVLMETELRIGQCRDSLIQLRTKLHAQARLLKHKYVNVRHQAPNTRSQDLLNRMKAKIETLAVKYRNAFMRLQVLDQDKESEWRAEFQELKDQDVRGLSEVELPDAATKERAQEIQARSLLSGGVVPEGNRKVSWIWRGSLRGCEDESGQDGYTEGLSLPRAT